MVGNGDVHDWHAIETVELSTNVNTKGPAAGAPAKKTSSVCRVVVMTSLPLGLAALTRFSNYSLCGEIVKPRVLIDLLGAPPK